MVLVILFCSNVRIVLFAHNVMHQQLKEIRMDSNLQILHHALKVWGMRWILALVMLVLASGSRM